MRSIRRAITNSAKKEVLDDRIDRSSIAPSARILHVPNGRGDRPQPGLIRGFETAAAAGEIEAYDWYPLDRHVEQLGSKIAWQQMCIRIASFQPTIVLMQHLSGPRRSCERIEELKRAARNATLIYHDPDAFGFGKPLPSAAKQLIRTADVSIGCGSGGIANEFRRVGAARYCFAPPSYDPERFGNAWDSSGPRDFEVVMVANNNSSRAPWRKMPGGFERAALMKLMGERFGSKFAVFGRGWTGKSAQGPISYDQQQEAIRNAWVSVNWDYFPTEAHYFSDRLPIALAAGVPHVTTNHPGYSDFFNVPGVPVLADNIDGILSRTEDLLASSQADLNHLGLAGASFAREHMSQTNSALALIARADIALKAEPARKERAV